MVSLDSEEIQEKMSNFVSHLKSLLVNGVIFPNGDIKTLDISIEGSEQTFHYMHGIEVGRDTSIQELKDQGKLWWKGIKILAGESSYGGDRFLAAIDLLSQKLIWLVFLDYSNPFTKVEIKGEEIYATSTLEYVWKFNIKTPINVSVSPLLCP